MDARWRSLTGPVTCIKLSREGQSRSTRSAGGYAFHFTLPTMTPGRPHHRTPPSFELLLCQLLLHAAGDSLARGMSLQEDPAAANCHHHTVTGRSLYGDSNNCKSNQQHWQWRWQCLFAALPSEHCARLEQCELGDVRPDETACSWHSTLQDKLQAQRYHSPLLTPNSGLLPSRLP